jgi:hypothetical protein
MRLIGLIAPARRADRYRSNFRDHPERLNSMLPRTIDRLPLLPEHILPRGHWTDRFNYPMGRKAGAPPMPLASAKGGVATP